MSRHPYYAKYDDYDCDDYDCDDEEEEETCEPSTSLWILQQSLELQQARNEQAEKESCQQNPPMFRGGQGRSSESIEDTGKFLLGLANAAILFVIIVLLLALCTS